MDRHRRASAEPPPGEAGGTATQPRPGAAPDEPTVVVTVVDADGADGAEEPDTTPRPHPVRVLSTPLSRPGLVAAAAFLALSLFPSMLPRGALLQGAVSGITMMVGYALGTAGAWAWRFLDIPRLHGRPRTVVVGVLLTLVAVMLLSSAWQHVGWQNSLRELLGMEPVGPGGWPVIVAVTVPVAALLLLAARSVRKLFQWIALVLDRWVPRRVSRLLGGVAVVVLLSLVYTNVLTDGFFTVSNQIFSARDSAEEEGVVQPTSELRSGSPTSAAPWETLGRQGRAFVAGGPTVEQLDAFHGGGAMEPIRVYVGLKTAPTLQERADLLLRELVRTGAFDRDVLVVATTTGTGFLQPQAVDSLEFVHNGNTAIAGVQYSYLPSWISLLADQEEVQQTSRVVFDTVHSHWRSLPEDDRPRLYVYGLSLGSYGAETILSSIGVVNAPIDGAFLTGPPFVNDMWHEIVAGRVPGTPPWLPKYEDGRTVRFASEGHPVDVHDGDWGPTRILYLQHSSDPVVWFSPDLLTESPDWLEDDERGPDIPDEFVWIPLVTMWQVLFDLPTAGSVPEGHGHLYTAEANASGWAAVTGAEGWTQEMSERVGRLVEAESQTSG